MIKIEYWNSYDILDVHYEGSYRNRFWLNVDIKNPVYPITKEASEDSLGESHNSFLRWEKQYTFKIFCTEPLADAISTITMHDNVWITFFNGFSVKAKEFLADIKWTDVEGLAEIAVTFITQSYTVNGSSAAQCS